MASGFLRLRQTQELLASTSSSTVVTTTASGTSQKNCSGSNPGPRGTAISRDAQPLSTCTSSPSCVMWIHLQTSICTEWEHSSMAKRPQTIHRCILQRQQTTSGSQDLAITCHVCGFDYHTYQTYLHHLFDSSCAQRKPSSAAIEKKKKEIKVNHVWTNLCPHFAAATQSQSISLDDFLYDEATLSTLKVELASLLTGLLGEHKLVAIGYPEKDILTLLKSLLKMAKCQPVQESCSPACARLESVLNQTQVKYQKLKSQLAAARLNTVRLLEICLPDQRLWKQNKWHEKPIETILAEIISGDANTSLHSPVILLD